jgi:hypothetical protein
MLEMHYHLSNIIRPCCLTRHVIVQTPQSPYATFCF